MANNSLKKYKNRKLKRTEIAALGLRVAVGESVEERERSRFYFPLIFLLQRESDREKASLSSSSSSILIIY